MKSFDDWLRNLEVTYVKSDYEPLVFPEGVTEKNGKFMAVCNRCEQEYEIPCDLSEFDVNYSYCGGSPRCCP